MKNTKVKVFVGIAIVLIISIISSYVVSRNSN